MFIELAESLRCPCDHDESYCVLAMDDVADRTVERGMIGCPVCKREFPIEDGIADFVPPDEQLTPPAPVAAVAVEGRTLQALIGLSSPGGYVVLLGSAAVCATQLAALIEGVHFVGVNVPAHVAPSQTLSILRSIRRVPLRSSMGRAVIIGAEYATDPWIGEGARVLLRGQRLVILTEDVAPRDVRQLVIGQGVWVGEKQ